MKEKIIAIILAAGQGKRMNSKIKKQYLTIGNIPIIVNTLMKFDSNNKIDEIILVTDEKDIEYCKKNIIKIYNFNKVSKVIAGGKERYHSVYSALQTITNENAYVLIHDGARPFVTKQIINKCIEQVLKNKACVVGIPVKDTIKKINEDDGIIETIDRKRLISIQTPQAFSYKLIKKAYDEFIRHPKDNITDDSMVLELYTQTPIKSILGDYNNIKITTQEDMLLGEVIQKIQNNPQNG